MCKLVGSVMLFCALGGGFTFSLYAASPAQSESSAPINAEAMSSPPLSPLLVAFARTQNIPTDGMDLAVEGTPSRAGDYVTLVVTQYQGNSQSQWLVKIEADALTAEEQGMRPPPEAVHYTSTGRELHYTTSRTALRVYFIGPFSSDASPSQEQLTAALSQPARVLVSPEHLQLGVYPYCQAGLVMVQRMKAAGFTNLYHISNTHPLSQDQLEKGKAFAAMITEDEEYKTFGAYFALKAFLDTARSIKPFDELLTQTMAKPSALVTLARLGTVSAFLNYDCRQIRRFEGKIPNLELPSYELPIKLMLNGRLGLKTKLLVTSPRVPLQTCAGIIGLDAEHPNDSSKRLIIRVVASRPSPKPAT